MNPQPQRMFSSPWVREFDRQMNRRKHLVLYGNVNDYFLHAGQYQTVSGFLMASFVDRGFSIVTQYDPIDGFRFEGAPNPPPPANPGKLPDGMADRFRELVRRGIVARNPELGTPPAGPGGPPLGPGDPMHPPPPRIPGPGRGEQRRVTPEEAFSQLRTVLAQSAAPIAAIVDLGDMLTSEANRYLADERNALVLLKRCTLEASLIPSGRLAGYRNTLVVMAGELKRVPEWFYLDNPHVALVRVPRPDKEERRQFALQFMRPSGSFLGFYGADSLVGPADLQTVCDEFADLTDGMQSIDLEALRVTSHSASLPVRPKEVRRLVDYFKFGLRDDPWEQLDATKVKKAGEILGGRVIGQPRAVNAVVSMLTSARVGLSMRAGGGTSSKPKGVFFFVGPTGVGKTELAKALTELVFGDEKAFARFDMSEYKEEHSAEKLAGAPPGFVGYEEGGQLTNRVLQQPYSILLFDEIEKAHPRVLDKFLQILEDGRLTDGKGQTAYFNQTAIVFTSNIGASDLTDPNSGQIIRHGIMGRVREAGADTFSYEQVEQHFRGEVDWFFSSRIGRAELLNRFGDNVVVFDLLRPAFVGQIGQKFLNQMVAAGREKYGFELTFDASVGEFLLAQMKAGENLLMGGRRIGALLETVVERPLNRWLFENVTDFGALRGRRLRAAVVGSGVLEVVYV